jgi:hypothetical protein
MKGKERLDVLNELVNIIHDELALDQQLLTLCEQDSRLGFHSEAEGYKYFPAKIQWRIDQLKSVLANDVTELRRIIRKDELLFPEYTGLQPEGTVAYCIQSKEAGWPGSREILPVGLQWQKCAFGPGKNEIKWASEWDENTLYIWIKTDKNCEQNGSLLNLVNIDIKIEPQRLRPCRHFVFDMENTAADDLMVTRDKSGVCYVGISISFEKIGITTDDLHPVRMDVRVQNRVGEISSWRPDHPLTSRLILGSDNPLDLGWLVFEDKR